MWCCTVSFDFCLFKRKRFSGEKTQQKQKSKPTKITIPLISHRVRLSGKGRWKKWEMMITRMPAPMAGETSF